MKIALIGATGFVGKHLLTELTSRGHQVTAISRNPEKITLESDLIVPAKGNAFDAGEIVVLVAGSDAIISAYNPGWTNPNIYKEFLQGSEAIQEAAKKAGVKRVLFIGGAGSLEIAPGLQLIDTPEFPQEYKDGANGAREYLDILKKETDLDWTFLSPAIEMNPGTAGTRKGVYRTGLDNPVFNEEGRSIISVEDLSVAIVDEIEKPAFIKKRFTVGY